MLKVVFEHHNPYQIYLKLDDCCIFAVVRFKYLKICWLIADWSVENMNPDLTPNRLSLDVDVSPKNLDNKRYTKYQSVFIAVLLFTHDVYIPVMN